MFLKLNSAPQFCFPKVQLLRFQSEFKAFELLRLQSEFKAFHCPTMLPKPMSDNYQGLTGSGHYQKGATTKLVFHALFCQKFNFF